MNDAPQEKKNINADLKPTPVQVHAQYVKDFSFENPGAPETLRMTDVRPEMTVDLMLDAIKINDDRVQDLYESSLTLKVKSTINGEVAFIAEIVYAAMVSFKDIAPSQIKYILYVEVPQLLFPFARQMVANAVSAGGLPPLLLNPMDFRGMYENSQKKEQGNAA